jgi:hypothetical protein
MSISDISSVTSGVLGMGEGKRGLRDFAGLAGAEGEVPEGSPAPRTQWADQRTDRKLTRQGRYGRI